ncbi:MAG TPA: phosphate signaling complex protein PhoU [Elusimicrobiota bacterium]|nr:phosphate signaling complex protein PhoU [Elusimicrobiota bacterium]
METVALRNPTTSVPEENAVAEVESLLLHMGGLAERMIDGSIRILTERRQDVLADIVAQEAEVNELHLKIDELCLKILSRGQPGAEDVRLFMACVKVNSDIERVADHAVNIAESGAIIAKHPHPHIKLLDIVRMAELAQTMLKGGLEAFAKRDGELARFVISQDDEEDRMKRAAFEELMGIMRTNATLIQNALGLILVSRNLERIADHATNIAKAAAFLAAA